MSPIYKTQRLAYYDSIAIAPDPEDGRDYEKVYQLNCSFLEMGQPFRAIPLTQGKAALVDERFYQELLDMGQWHANKIGNTYYAARNKPYVSGKPQGLLYLHREVVLLSGQDLGDLHVDHISGDGLDNRLANLRLVTCRQNHQNHHTHRSGRLYGACWDQQAQRWRAFVCLPGSGRRHHIGLYDSELEAHLAYKRAVDLIQAGFSGTPAELRRFVAEMERLESELEPQ